MERRAKRREIRILHEAIKSNDVEKVQVLLTPEIDVNFQYGGESALQKAVIQGSFSISKLLIEHGADVNKSNAEDNTLLNMACWRGYRDVVQLLVETGADLNLYNNHSSTPLNTAAYRGHAEITSILSHHPDCDLNRPNKRGRAPLTTAAWEGHSEVVSVLVHAGADLEWTDNERKTALIAAVERGQGRAARVIIGAGCDVDATDRYGCSALWYAAKQGHREIVRELVKGQANLNKTDHRGSSPFMEAVRSLDVETVKCLAAAGCDVNIKEHHTQQAAINIAVSLASQVFGERAQYADLVSVLLRLGCDVNSADTSGWTPLHHAAFGGETEIVRLLLEKQTLITMVTEQGQTPLHGAIFGNSAKIVELLLEKGAQVNAVDKNFRTPLYLGIHYRCKPQVLVVLLEAGADTEIPELEEGRTPLFEAVEQQHTEAVRLLLQHNADVNAPNKAGDCPLWLACDKSHEDIVDVLLGNSDIDVNQGVSHLPLHAAVQRGMENTVRKLIDRGAEVNKLTDMCTSALFCAADANHVTLARLLVHHGADPCSHYRVKTPRKCCFTYTDPHPHLEIEPLQCALRNDSFHMIKVLLQASPQMPYRVLSTLRDLVFRTDYVRDARLGQRLIVQYAHFFALILREPRSLQEACRGRVRVSLGERPFNKVDGLPVPRKIKDFILMKESLLKEFYP